VTALLVLHDFGLGYAGGPWGDALSGAGWPGRVLAPDLPGHGDAPPSIDASYDPVDAAWLALRTVRAADLASRPIVMGVGRSGFAAQMLGVAGRAAGIVLIDGVAGPARSAVEIIADQCAWLREMADDPLAMVAPPHGAPDPRLRHGAPGWFSRKMAEDAVRNLTIPVLVIETTSSGADDALLALFGGPLRVHRADRDDPDAVAPLVVGWGNDLDRVSPGP
jgi:pimeloyl-ACP methyl ester carboxylesterase